MQPSFNFSRRENSPSRTRESTTLQFQGRCSREQPTCRFAVGVSFSRKLSQPAHSLFAYKAARAYTRICKCVRARIKQQSTKEIIAKGTESYLAEIICFQRTGYSRRWQQRGMFNICIMRAASCFTTAEMLRNTKGILWNKRWNFRSRKKRDARLRYRVHMEFLRSIQLHNRFTSWRS